MNAETPAAGPRYAVRRLSIVERGVPGPVGRHRAEETVTATRAPAVGVEETQTIEPIEPAESPEDLEAAAPRKRSWWRRALSWVTTGAVLVLLTLGIVLALIPAMNGGTALTVLSGSMQPTLKPGDVVVVFPVDGFEDIELGDVVTFMPNPDDPTLVTHRAKA
ncbi:MAG: S26 family signal peptidase, partial [Bifidobacteriaceae bacterium]|nr:S26 family signal peptidase [Bifidobacteriaceae bacterium]